MQAVRDAENALQKAMDDLGSDYVDTRITHESIPVLVAGRPGMFVAHMVNVTFIR